MVPLFGAAYVLHQIKAPQFYTDLGLKKKNSVESSCKW